MKSSKKRMLMLSIIMILSILVSGCGTPSGDSKTSDSADKKIIMKYSHGTGTSAEDPHNWVALKFKEKVEKYSDGRIEVQIFPSGQLGSEQKSFQDVQNGVIQAASVTLNNTAAFSKSMGTLDLPYMFKSGEEVDKVLNDLGDDLNQKLIEESGTHSIIWFNQGFRNLVNSKKPVNTIDDLKGIKVRVPQNKIMIATYKAWGAETTPLAWDETFGALQQGVVDATDHPYSVILSSKFNEILKYLTELHYKPAIYHVVVNEKWLQKLPDDLREAVLKAGKETQVESQTFLPELEVKALQQLKDSGMEYAGVPKDEDVWMQKSMAIWPDFYGDIGGTDTLDKVMNVLGRKAPK